MSMPSPVDPVQPVEVAVASAEESAEEFMVGAPPALPHGTDGATAEVAPASQLEPAAYSVFVGRAAVRKAAAPSKSGLRGRFFLLAGAVCLGLSLAMFFAGAAYGNSAKDSDQLTGALAQVCSVVPCLAAVGLLTFGGMYGLFRRLPQ